MFSNNLKFIQKNLKLPIENIKKIIIKNSWLLSINPQTEFFPILNLLQEFGISYDQIGKILMKDGTTLSPKNNSLTDLRKKLKYLVFRFSLDLTIEQEGGIFPEILNKDYYKFIQARGEIMVKSKNVRKFEEIYWLSDKQFLEYMGVSENQWQVELNKTGTK